jgi:hypothetical protein
MVESMGKFIRKNEKDLTMSVTITTFPRKTVGSNTSKWVAAHNPIIYQMARRDFTVNNVQINTAYNATKPAVSVSATTALQQSVFAAIAAGDRVYLSAAPYVGLYEVVSTHVAGSNYHIVIDTSYVGVAWSGYLNALDTLSNYWLETQVVKWNGIAWENVGAPLRNYPNTSGVFKLDVQAVIQNLPAFWDSFDYATLNVKDTNQSGFFNIKWRENWDGSTNAFTNVLANNRHFFVNAARQIGAQYGQNMFEHVPFEPSNAKFLSGFERPVFFPGYPFDLAFIYSDAISGHPVHRMERLRGVDGVTSAPSSTLLDASQSVYVNRMLTSESFGNAASVDVWLESDPSGPPTGGMPYVVIGYVLPTYQSGLPSFNPSM